MQHLMLTHFPLRFEQAANLQQIVGKFFGKKAEIWNLMLSLTHLILIDWAI